MEVVVVTRRWDPRGGGCERYLFDLVRFFRRAGHPVRVVTESPAGGAGAAHGNDPYLPALAFSTLTKADLARGFPGGSPVLASYPVPGATHVQLHSGIQACAFEAERESFDSSLRRWLWRPALSLNRRRARLPRIEKEVLGGQMRPRLMVWSASLSRELERWYDIPSKEIEVSIPGVDLTCFHAVPGAEEVRGRLLAGADLLLLFVAHNFRLKGLVPLLEAVAAAGRKGLRIRLAVAGGGSAGFFRRRAARLGVGSQIEFLGRVAREDLPALYGACDALAHPTFYDPFSLVAMEALACGRPVITTWRNGAAELIEPGRQGFLLDDPRDIDGLVAAFQALSARGKADSMREEALALARRYPFDDHARAVLAWLLAGRP